jgi:chemotaxis protein CheC
MNISHDELDALRELLNIGVGRATGSLNDMIGETVWLNVPSVRLVEPDELGGALGGDDGRPVACVRLSFEGALRGVANLIFPSEGGSKLAALLTDEELVGPDEHRLRAETLTEIGNVLLNGLMGSITNVVSEHIAYSAPVYVEETAGDVEAGLRATKDSAVLLAQAQFFVGKTSFEIGGDRIDGEITLLLGVDSLERLIERVHCLGEEAVM